MIGLYLHIPFCAQKCHYCNFVISTRSVAEHGGAFLEALEIQMRHEAGVWNGRVFDTLYVGGGTPSLLSPDQTRRLFERVHAHFRISQDAEITWEANPDDVTPEKAPVWRKAGINRISIGVQSMNDATLKNINRRHDAQTTRMAFDQLRAAGFKNISADVMLGLPGETLEDVQHTLEELRKLNPEHVSLYELVIEEKTVFWKWYANNGHSREGGNRADPRQKHSGMTSELPAEETQIQILKLARTFLKNNGWEHYELLSYAKPGFESRHNQIYWANGEYLGLGPGAYSYVSGRRLQWAKSVDDYFKKIHSLDWRCDEEETLSPEKRQVESLLLALRRVKEGASTAVFADVIARKKEELAALFSQRLLEEAAGAIRLTGQGQLFAESVFSTLAD